MNKLWWVIFALTGIIILLLIFQPNPPATDTTVWKQEIENNKQKAEELKAKHDKDSAQFAQKIAQLRDSLSKEQKHGVKLSSSLQALKSKLAVVKIIQENPVIDSVFQQYDLLLETKDNQINIQSKIIKGLEDENKRITENFLERLKLSDESFVAQSEIAKEYKKQLRKERRKKKLATVLIPVVGVTAFLLGGL